MSDQQTSNAPRGFWGIVAVVVGLLVVWQVTMHFVRQHVTAEIVKNVGGTLPAFELVDLDGVTWSRDGLRGRTVVLHFFRSYCQACQIEAPTIRAFAAEQGEGGAVVIGVMMDEVEGYPPAVTRASLEEFGFRHPVIMADEAFVEGFHGLGWAHVTPVTYVADGTGEITAALRGHQSLDALRAAVR